MPRVDVGKIVGRILAGLWLLAPGGARAGDERGGNFDIVLEGGALVGATTSSTAHLAPVGQITGLGRFRAANHLASLPASRCCRLQTSSPLVWLAISSGCRFEASR